MSPSLFDQSKYIPYYRRLSLVYQKPEIRASVEIILSVFAVMFLTLVAIRPTLVTVAELKKKIADQELVEKKITTKIGHLTKAQTQLNDYVNELVLFEEAVPEKYNYGDLAKRVEILTKENGVIIESLAFSEASITGEEEKSKKEEEKQKKENLREWEDGNNKVIEFTIKFDVIGQQHDVVNFLSQLQNMDRLVVLASVDLIKVENRRTGLGKLRASGEGKGYYLINQANQQGLTKKQADET